MTLEQQLQTLIAQAPADGRTPHAIQAIVPILRQYAEDLGELNYYIRQSPQGNWEVITLQHHRHPQQQKTVIYAYARQSQALEQGMAGLVAVKMPVVSLLFQLVALEPVDSLLVVAADPQAPIQEIERATLRTQITQVLSLPPNLA